MYKTDRCDLTLANKNNVNYGHEDNPEFLIVLTVYTIIEIAMNCDIKDIPEEVLDDLIRRLQNEK